MRAAREGEKEERCGEGLQGKVNWESARLEVRELLAGEGGVGDGTGDEGLIKLRSERRPKNQNVRWAKVIVDGIGERHYCL